MLRPQRASAPKLRRFCTKEFLQTNQGLNRDPEARGDNSAPAQGDLGRAEQEAGEAGAPGVKGRCESQAAPASAHPQAGRGHGEAPGAHGGDTLAPVTALSNRPG